MTRFHIGTSGWQYDHWRGASYPQKLGKAKWLAYYVERFPTVELNNSFYRQPSVASWQRWRETAPEGFRFAVKASRFITHIKRLKDPEDSLKRLFEGAERLEEHLGPVLYQMPPNFQRTPENVERLQRFLSLLPARHQNVLEFRDDSWFGEETLADLRRRRVGFCIHDMGHDNDCPVAATAPFAYVRFHGCAGAKYQGKYTPAMLKAWAAKLRELGRDLDDVWVYFNNDAHGYAVSNALDLTRLLS